MLAAISHESFRPGACRRTPVRERRRLAPARDGERINPPGPQLHVELSLPYREGQHDLILWSLPALPVLPVLRRQGPEGIEESLDRTRRGHCLLDLGGQRGGG
jgi:hypothetical protein